MIVERVFVAIGCGVETRAAQIAQLSALFPNGSLPGKPVPPANWHVTLRWVGDVDEVTVDRLLAGLDEADLGHRFTVTLGGLGAFPRPDRAGVLWRSVSAPNDRIQDLANEVEEVCQAVGLPAEERPYVPHLTLSRFRPQVDAGRHLDVDLRPLRMPVRAVTILRSLPARPTNVYEPIDSLELEG